MDDADLDALAALRLQSITTRTRPAPIIVVPNFLPQDLRDHVFEGLVAKENDFKSNRTDGRDGLALVNPRAASPVIDEIEQRFDEFVVNLTSQGAPLSDVSECLLETAAVSATGHANFHAPHIDNDALSGIEAVLSRRISFAWYAFHEPRMFMGGELRLWDYSEIPSPRGPWTPAASWTDYACNDNTLIAFSSYSLHEVLPVHLHSGTFADRRFAVVTSAHCPA